MSHLHNLFHKGADEGRRAPHASIPLVQEVFVSSAAPAAVAAVAEVTSVAGFPVEEARLDSTSRVVYHTDPRSPAADKIRFLRMRLREYWASGKLKKLLVTSPLAGDGKTTILLNLATALAERGKRSVLVIEADLHHSSVAERLKLRDWAGLTECLQDDSISPLSHIRRVEPLGWHLLPAGEPRRNPTELLQTPALRLVLQKVAECFDWVLIDSPPVVPLTDSIALHQHVDASLLVVRAGHTPQEAIEQTIDLLGQKKIAGIVLNGIERRNQPHYQQRYYDGGSGRDDD
jgi:capsular exopolysaccharide synthesis family protein